MRTIQRALLGVAALGMAMQAQALTVNFSYLGFGGDPVANGALELSLISGNNYRISSGSLTLTGAGADNGVYTLLSSGDAAPGSNIPSPTGAFWTDNVYFDCANPVLSNWGALFGNGGKELNLWGNAADNYSLYVGTAAGVYSTADDGGQLTVDRVCVPDGGATVALMGLGMLGVAGLRRRNG